tara:strand:- start:770 stop:1036 length:267 start_codon:yes stop_codon:yes gene_type:complete
MPGLNRNMIGGSYKFSDLLRNTKTKTKTKTKKKKKKSDPSQIGYPARKSNLNIIMKGQDGNLYKNKRYKKTKRWVKINKKKRLNPLVK